MGVRRFEDLIAWQLAYELQEEVFAFTAQGPASLDYQYCHQIRESCRSATRNTAEGFGRYTPKDFVRFLRFAAGSLQETRTHLTDGLKRRYLSPDEHKRLTRLALRAFRANTRLTAYVFTSTAPTPSRNR